jgi:hypothetical protein
MVELEPPAGEEEAEALQVANDVQEYLPLS